MGVFQMSKDLTGFRSRFPVGFLRLASQFDGKEPAETCQVSGVSTEMLHTQIIQE
jgi:hypothetical protein